MPKSPCRPRTAAWYVSVSLECLAAIKFALIRQGKRVLRISAARLYNKDRETNREEFLDRKNKKIPMLP